MAIINCTEFNERLDRTIESRQTVDEAALREHAQSCAACRTAWQDAMLVDSALARWTLGVPSIDLCDAVLFQVAAASESLGPPSLHEATAAAALSRPAAGPAGLSASRRGWRLAAFAAVTTACALGIAAMTIWMPRGNGLAKNIERAIPAAPVQIADSSPKGAPSPVALAPAEKQNPRAIASKRLNGTPVVASESALEPSADVAGHPPIQSLVRGAGFAYLELAGGAAKALASAAVLLPAPKVADEPSPVQKPDNHLINGVERGLQPVTRQLGQAFEFLIQAVPAERAPAT